MILGLGRTKPSLRPPNMDQEAEEATLSPSSALRKRLSERGLSTSLGTVALASADALSSIAALGFFPSKESRISAKERDGVYVLLAVSFAGLAFGFCALFPSHLSRMAPKSIEPAFIFPFDGDGME